MALEMSELQTTSLVPATSDNNPNINLTFNI